jgi:hypothetical protein
MSRFHQKHGSNGEKTSAGNSAQLNTGMSAGYFTISSNVSSGLMFRIFKYSSTYLV